MWVSFDAKPSFKLMDSMHLNEWLWMPKNPFQSPDYLLSQHQYHSKLNQYHIKTNLGTGEKQLRKPDVIQNDKNTGAGRQAKSLTEVMSSMRSPAIACSNQKSSSIASFTTFRIISQHFIIFHNTSQPSGAHSFGFVWIFLDCWTQTSQTETGWFASWTSTLPNHYHS